MSVDVCKNFFEECLTGRGVKAQMVRQWTKGSKFLGSDPSLGKKKLNSLLLWPALKPMRLTYK